MLDSTIQENYDFDYVIDHNIYYKRIFKGLMQFRERDMLRDEDEVAFYDARTKKWWVETDSLQTDFVRRPSKMDSLAILQMGLHYRYLIISFFQLTLLIPPILLEILKHRT